VTIPNADLCCVQNVHVNVIIDAFCTCRRSGVALDDWSGIATRRNYFGRGSGPIWLSNVHCTGAEMSLAECGHYGWGELDHCSAENRDDVAVICDNSTCLPSCSLAACCVSIISVLFSFTFVDLCSTMNNKPELTVQIDCHKTRQPAATNLLLKLT